MERTLLFEAINSLDENFDDQTVWPTGAEHNNDDIKYINTLQPPVEPLNLTLVCPMNAGLVGHISKPVHEIFVRCI